MNGDSSLKPKPGQNLRYMLTEVQTVNRTSAQTRNGSAHKQILKTVWSLFL